MAIEASVALPFDYRPQPVQPGDDRFVDLALEIGRQIAPRAAAHDRENTFVAENYDLMRAAGYLRLTVPESLGGLGASMRQAVYAQAELAKHCASTALAVNMHLYIALVNTYRWRHGAPGVEAALRRVSEEGLVFMTSGGSDGIWPSAKATKVDGGYRVTGRKAFCSQAPVANMLLTTAVYDDPADGPVVLVFSVPTSSVGYETLNTWDTLGMRATGSQDVQLNDVFVPDGAISASRQWGKIDPVLLTAAVHFVPTVSAVYFGVAAGARNEAVRLVRERKRGDGVPLAQDPVVHHQMGVIEHKLRLSWWAILGSLGELGEDPTPNPTAMNALSVTKRFVTEEAVNVVDLAMDVVGGSAFYKRSPLERAYRDVRAGKFHPLGSEKALFYSGRLALGLPVDEIW